LGIGDWGLGPIPNPQSPIPNPQSPFKQTNITLKFIIILSNCIGEMKLISKKWKIIKI
jgi:hypothetical protein